MLIINDYTVSRVLFVAEREFCKNNNVGNEILLLVVKSARPQ
jgi:hypothetical protein